MAKNQEFKSLDQYIKEAEIPPFELPISEDETMVFPSPTAGMIDRAAEGYRANDAKLILWALCGDQWPKLEEILDPIPYEARDKIVEDMLRHFKIVVDQEVTFRGSDGKEFTESDPDKIKYLQKAGFKIVGESQPK